MDMVFELLNAARVHHFEQPVSAPLLWCQMKALLPALIASIWLFCFGTTS